tara:strand:+ start:853 stop:1020 length:168 start_codon:yes stop_codon:yes gene_type:complete
LEPVRGPWDSPVDYQAGYDERQRRRAAGLWLSSVGVVDNVAQDADSFQFYFDDVA